MSVRAYSWSRNTITQVILTESFVSHASGIQDLKRQKQFTEVVTVGSSSLGNRGMRLEWLNLRAGTGTCEQGVLASRQVLMSLKGHHEIVSVSPGKTTDWNQPLLLEQTALLWRHWQVQKANREKQVLSYSSRLAISLLAAPKRKLAGRGEKWLAGFQP